MSIISSNATLFFANKIMSFAYANDHILSPPKLISPIFFFASSLFKSAMYILNRDGLSTHPSYSFLHSETSCVSILRSYRGFCLFIYLLNSFYQTFAYFLFFHYFPQFLSTYSIKSRFQIYEQSKYFLFSFSFFFFSLY